MRLGAVEGASTKLLHSLQKAERICSQLAWILSWLSLQVLSGPLIESLELCVNFSGISAGVLNVSGFENVLFL